MSDTLNAPGRVAIGSGSDSLTLLINQDAYLGNAQYVVRVDGVQVGEVLTASALRSSGEVDVVTVRGDWKGGSHTVAVEFLNDAWDGSPETDRNLFLVSASQGGRDVDGATASLMRPEAATFSFADPLRVLPLGDSNTHGWDNSKDEATWEAYRKPLWDMATSRGLSIDFVGPRSNGSANLPDHDHFGVSGITATEVAGLAQDLAQQTQPDVVLLMLGSNDALREGDAAQTVPGELLSIMRSIVSVTPHAEILFASLPAVNAELLPFRADANEIREAINAQLPGVAAQARAEGIDARFVPVSYGLDDLTDGAHLTEAAHGRLAQAWFDALIVG